MHEGGKKLGGIMLPSRGKRDIYTIPRVLMSEPVTVRGNADVILPQRLGFVLAASIQ
jgi:hypothetical protein